MKKIFLFFLFNSYMAILFAQKETYEFTSYIPPAGWKKEVKERAYTSYTITNQQKKTYCQLFIMLSTSGKGDIKQDFETEWQNLVTNQYGVKKAIQETETVTENGWQIKTALGNFTFNNQNCAAMLTTMSGYNKVVSIVSVTNSEDYTSDIEKFMESVEMGKPSTDVPLIQTNDAPSGNGQFTFTTTNFDDGWVSIVKEDWVEVTKGNTRVLIHYPNKLADAYNSVVMDGLKDAWNILVAPRYSTASNMEFRPITGWQSIEFAEADMVEKETGSAFHVVLFKMNYSGGNGKYMEFITPTKMAFEQEFGAYHQTSYGWEKLERMASYNKFAVSSSDLIGKWSTSDFASISYYYVNTGGLASTSTTSTTDEFTFLPENNYTSQHSGASGQVGNIKFSSKEYKGKSVVADWNITLTNRFQGASENFSAAFQAIKGGRILILTDRLGTTLSLVKHQ